MKRVVAVVVFALLFLAVGCAQKQEIKVIFSSDPPGGTLYKPSGEVWGSCPKELWYDIDSEAIKKGYLDAKGMAMRWPTGPERRSGDLIRLTVDGTDREVVFYQPKYKTEAPTGDLQVGGIEDLREKGAEWQKARRVDSAKADQTRTLLALTSKMPVTANKSTENLSGLLESRNHGTLTLEPGHLMLLDWSSLNRRSASVERRVSGSGVQFEIHFLSNSPGSCSRSFVSSGAGGRGDLIGADVSDYEEFALKLTLVWINGSSDPNLTQELVVGAVIGPTADGNPTSYEPVTLSLAAPEKAVTAITRVSADRVYEIGFHLHVEDHLDWDAAGSKVVLRVEPAEGGEAAAFNVPTG